MIADLICVGNEILTGLVENSNSGYLSRQLWLLGIKVREVSIVADEERAIRAALERAFEHSNLIIITGGLGPTEDDLTREIVARSLNRPLILDREWLEHMKNLFSSRGFKMTDNNTRQAMIIEGAELLENNRGTAPGLMIDEKGKLLFLLPGPPNEMEAIFQEKVVPRIVTLSGDDLNLVKTLKCVGFGESALEDLIRRSGSNNLPPLSYIAKGSEVDLQLKGSGTPEEARQMIEKSELVLRELLGQNIFGTDQDTLAGVVADLLLKTGKTVALAESCSGGLLADHLTDISGSSNYFLGSLVVYSTIAKRKILGLDAELLEREGEVSEATAKAMADKVRSLLTADLGLGITGLAGPLSDNSNKKVGLIYVALADEKGISCRELNLNGGRRLNKERAAQTALIMLREKLLDL